MSAPCSTDWVAALALVLLAIWLFRGHFLGDSLWIGNPDRLNSDFKILRHYLSGLSGGNIPAWNEHEMMGYDSFVMPYTFPNPLDYLVWLFGESNLNVSMGYVAIAMLATAGLAAYAFIRSEVSASAAALVGAICYEFSSLTLLKVSQNRMSFAVFIVIPLLALAIRHIRRETAARCFLFLAILLACMLNFMFLQKAAYALMLTGAYAAWRSYVGKAWLPVLVFGLALSVALGFSFPRILSLAMALAEYRREVSGIDLQSFDVLYEFQNIYSYEILRWFDNTIFGRSPSDAHALGNNINLTEGFLLSTSAIVPLLLLTGLARDHRGWLNIGRSSNNGAAFFFWALIACISVIVVKPAAHLIYLLFLRMDFTHARILIAALLPLSVLLALTLSKLTPPIEGGVRNLREGAVGLAAGLLAALAIESIAGQFPGTVSLGRIVDIQRHHMSGIRVESLVRIALSTVIFLFLLRATLVWKLRLRQIAYTSICALLAGQCLLNANQQINGPQTFNFLRPFNWGDFYQARREEFRPPSGEQLRALHRRIEPDRYRVALVCEPDIANGFCAGHVPEFWRLRSIDGYYGLGIPARLRALPWPTGVSLRTISFSSIDTIPWELLGFLNVRWVLVSGDGVFRNIVREGDRITGLPDPVSFNLVSSPARVTPRAFFSAAVEPVASAHDAVTRLFRPEGIVDPTVTSFVEGVGEAKRFESAGNIDLRGQNDLLDLTFPASPAERFLVLNDLYYPGWHAEADGRELPIFATNAVMRGVLVPAGADHVRFRYVTYLRTPQAWGFRLSAVMVMLGLFLGLRRFTNRT
jgi:hypothetical protein